MHTDDSLVQKLQPHEGKDKDEEEVNLASYPVPAALVDKVFIYLYHSMGEEQACIKSGETAGK